MVQKKSLISNLKTSKKAVLASKTSTPAAAKGTNLSKQAVLSKQGIGPLQSTGQPLSKKISLSKSGVGNDYLGSGFN